MKCTTIRHILKRRKLYATKLEHKLQQLMLNSYINLIKGCMYCMDVTNPFLYVTVKRNRTAYSEWQLKNRSLELVTVCYDVFRHIPLATCQKFVISIRRLINSFSPEMLFKILMWVLNHISPPLSTTISVRHSGTYSFFLFYSSNHQHLISYSIQQQQIKAGHKCHTV